MISSLLFFSNLLVNHIQYEATAKPSSLWRFHGSIMLVDVSGFTTLSTIFGPDDFQVIINTYFTLLLDVISQFKGDVIRYAGDEILIGKLFLSYASQNE